jgi:transcriptional regulator with XRE-family HTH domain
MDRQNASMDLAERLRTERERRNLGQHEVAAAIGVSRPTVTQWETGAKKPGRANLEALAVYYRLRIDDLLGHATPEGHIEIESEEEARALLMMRHAPPHIRDAVMTILGTWSGSQAGPSPGVTKK